MLPSDALSLLLSRFRAHLLPSGNRAGCCTGLRGEPPQTSVRPSPERGSLSFPASSAPERTGPGVRPISTDLAAAAGQANEIIRRTIEAYPGRTTLSCSFGGPSGMVLLDLALRIEPQLNVFVVDTDLLFPETYALIERVERRYGITVERVHPEQSVDEQNATHGDALWKRDPDACCDLRKVEPLRAYLRNFDAWLTAVRRDQSDTRTELPVQAWDENAADRQGGAARRVDRSRRVGLRARARRSGEHAALRRLSEHRLHALHAPRRAGRTRACRTLGRASTKRSAASMSPEYAAPHGHRARGREQTLR